MKFISILLVVLVSACGLPTTYGEENDKVNCILSGNDCDPAENTPVSNTTPTTPEKGDRGDVGKSGRDGESCSTEVVDNGVIVKCGTQDPVVITNGNSGEMGIAGPAGEVGARGEDAPQSPYDITQVIDPCGDGQGYDEVLLKLRSGQLMAHYADGRYQFITLIGPGSYATTDEQRCVFTVNSDMSVVW